MKQILRYCNVTNDTYFTRKYWKEIIGWNTCANYNIENDVIVIYYNWYVSQICLVNKRPLYIPFVLGNAKFKVVNNQ